MKNLFVLSVLIFLISCNSGPDFSWTLQSVDYDRLDYAVSIVLPGDIDPGEKVPQLIEIVEGELVQLPSQLLVGEYNELSWIVPGTTKAGQERLFELRFKKGSASDDIVGVEKNDSTLVIRKEGKEILHYRHSELPAPSGKTDLYARSGFIHPLYSPSGEELTWAQPADHIHHMGLWNPFTRVTWKENHTDFWNLASGLGTVRYKDVIKTVGGPVYAEIHLLHDHIAFMPQKPPFPIENQEESKEVIVMEEEWIVRIWNIDEGYLLDFTSLIRNVLDEPISLDAYRYGGGLGYRATSKWNKQNSSVLTSEGKTWTNGDATRAKWCWMSGDLEGTQTGLLFMSDPNNYDFPQPMRIWPDNSNGVGHQYFEFTPIREKTWVLDPGLTYSQKYRIWVQEGDVDAAKGEQFWLQYAEALDQKNSYLSN